VKLVILDDETIWQFVNPTQLSFGGYFPSKIRIFSPETPQLNILWSCINVGCLCCTGHYSTDICIVIKTNERLEPFLSATRQGIHTISQNSEFRVKIDRYTSICITFGTRSDLFNGRIIRVLYCTVLYCTVLYYTVLYCTVLYCTIFVGIPSFCSSSTR